jgi:RHS repeat-associated protein
VPAGIDCPAASCAHAFTYNTTVTLTATPAPAHAYGEWSGACTGSNEQPCQVTMKSAASVTSTFALPPPSVGVMYYHLDAVGSVRLVTDENKTVVAAHDYKPFGEDTGALTGDPRRFTGKELDAETALHYFGARYYRNVWGRFTTPDPVVNQASAAIDPQRWNRYSYALNRPLAMTDPDGREAGYVYLPSGRMLSPYDPQFPRSSHPLGDTVFLAGVVVVGGVAGELVASGAALDALKGLASSAWLGVTRLLNSPVVNEAYETARSGGRHAGTLRNYAGRSVGEIQRAIRSYELLVREHLDKLANPSRYAERWNHMTGREREILLNEWREHLTRNQELADVLRGLLESMQ